jgi:5'-phosphate synthase pdxT subunit
MRPIIGILGFQGDIEEHVSATKLALSELGLKGEVTIAKNVEQLRAIDGLIIPGGESTVMGGLSSFNRTIETVSERAGAGMPVFGTCSGLIMLAKKTHDKVIGETSQPVLGILDATIERNAFGRQRESFEADLDLSVLGIEKFRGVFIRAPVVKEIGPDVRVLSRLNESIVAVQQGIILGTAFHPELTADTRIHRYFLEMVMKSLPGDRNRASE